MLFLELFKGYITWDGSNGNNNVIVDDIKFVVTELVFVLATVEELGAQGGLAYERGGDARRNLRIKPLKENDRGVVQASENRQTYFFFIFLRVQHWTRPSRLHGVFPRIP